MRYPDEPHTLIGTVPVHLGAISMLRWLLESGHIVTLDDACGVMVEPFDLTDEQEYLFEALAEDLAISLRAGGLVVH